MKTKASGNSSYSGIYNWDLIRLITGHGKVLKEVIETGEKFVKDVYYSGRGCLCDASVVHNPFLLRVATLCHAKVYFVSGAQKLFFPLEKHPSFVQEAYEAKTLFDLSPFQMVYFFDMCCFMKTLHNLKVKLGDYERTRDKDLIPPIIDYKALKRLSKASNEEIERCILVISDEADYTLKMRTLLKRHHLWKKLREHALGSNFFEYPMTPSSRSMALDLMVPLTALKIAKLGNLKQLILNKRERQIYSQIQTASFILSTKAPSMTSIEKFSHMAKAVGIPCHLLSDITLPDFRQSIMEMSFKELSNPSGRLSLMPKLVKDLNNAAKQFSTIGLLEKTVNKIIWENQSDILEEFGPSKEKLKFHSFDLRNTTYPFSETYYQALIPSYIVEAIDKLSKQEKRTRKILKQELREIKEQLETIQFDLTEIELKVSMTNVAQGEFEIAFPTLGLPLGPHVTYKYHLYTGDVDLSQVAEAKQILSMKVDEIIEEIKDFSHETYNKLVLVKEGFVEEIYRALKKIRQKRTHY